MPIGSTKVVLAATVTAAALLLTACGGVGGGAAGGGGAPVAAPDTRDVGANDINPLAAADVADGGQFRWALDQIPDNFNRNQVDGTLADNKRVMDAVIPRPFTQQPDSTLALNEDYFTSIELTSTEPQVVTYTINPEANWNDGSPITWVDLQAQWQALNGTNEAFLGASTTGYEDVASVEQGVDERQAVVTYAQPYSGWRTLYGNGLYPAATNTDPDTFNTGWVNAVPVSAGPFRVETIDTTAQTITLVRDEAWWGEPAKLDQIIYRVVERAARADALANNEIEFYEIGADVNLFQRAQSIPGVVVRQANAPQYAHLTFNGGEGALLADPVVRRAVAQGVNREVILQALIGQIAPENTPLGNRIYVGGSANYEDNGDVTPFDPEGASAALEQAGWVAATEGGVREREGTPLNLRYVLPSGNPVSEQTSQLVRDQLAAIGVGVELVGVPSGEFFEQYVTPGNFDIAGFQWVGTVTPLVSSRNIYTSGGGQNYGSISSPEVDALFEEGLRELDDEALIDVGLRADRAIWELGHNLPLYQSPGAFAVRETVANFGALGYADPDYKIMGFTAG